MPGDLLLFLTSRITKTRK